MPCDNELYFYKYRTVNSPSDQWYVAKHKSAWALYKTLCRRYNLDPKRGYRLFYIVPADCVTNTNDDSTCEGREAT